jgi:hypothetical protein
MRLLVLIFFLLNLNFSFSQKVREEIMLIVDSISSSNSINDIDYIETDFKFNDLKSFIELKNKATFNELIELSNSDNKLIRYFSLIALVDLKYEKLDYLFKKTLDNDLSFSVKNGCIVSNESLSFVLYDRVLNQMYYNELSSKDSLFFVNKVKDFNRIILSKDKYYTLLYLALDNNNADLQNYSKIRKLAIRDQNQDAILELAKYKNKNDIQAFINLEEKAFTAISVFNDKKFWEFLVSYKNKNKSENYFNAIASFQNEESKNLLVDIINKKENDTVLSKVFKSSSRFYTPLYLDIFKEIFQKKGYLNIKIAEKLIEYNEKEASEIFSKKLLSDDLINIFFDYSTTTEIFDIYPLIISTVYKNNYKDLESICIKRIKILDSFYMQAFLDIAEKEKLKKTSAIIVEKLKNKNTAYNYFHLSKTIFSFENKKDIVTVIDLLKENEKDWNWGNWSESFNELFKAYNLNL